MSNPDASGEWPREFEGQDNIAELSPVLIT